MTREEREERDKIENSLLEESNERRSDERRIPI